MRSDRFGSGVVALSLVRNVPRMWLRVRRCTLLRSKGLRELGSFDGQCTFREWQLSAGEAAHSTPRFLESPNLPELKSLKSRNPVVFF